METRKYQIFVSSTFVDLVKERQAAIKAIVDLGHMPSGMEGFPAIDMEQFEYIKKVIDQCDYYVLIIGERYGSLAPDGISFTEKEYRYAVEKGQRVLAFIKEETPKEQLSDLSEKFEAFKADVKSKRLVRTWADGDDLKYPISMSLQQAFDQHPRQGWIRAPKTQSPKIAIESTASDGIPTGVAFGIVAVAAAIVIALMTMDSLWKHPAGNEQESSSPSSRSDATKILPPSISSPTPSAKASEVMQPPEKPPPVTPFPQERLSSEDIATKIGVWRGVDQQLNDLARVLNAGYLMLDTWLPDTVASRLEEIKKVEALGASVVKLRADFERLRNAYVTYADIADTLKEVAISGGRPPIPGTVFDRLIRSIDAFATQLGTFSDQLPENFEDKMRPYVGALTRDLNLVREWQSTIRQAAAANEKQLSKADSKQ